MPNRIVLIVEDDLNDEHLTLRAIRQARFTALWWLPTMQPRLFTS